MSAAMNSGSNTREPPKTKAILATPLNVEESRAQRQQRSQARFRDRGGIFVPSNRNTLADILLGKAAPLKKPRRSVSASPLGHLSKGPSVAQLGRISSPTKRTAAARNRSRSPLKQSRKSNHGGGGANTGVECSHSQSPRKSAASTSRAKTKAKPTAKPTKTNASTLSTKAHTEDESGDETDAAPPKAPPKAKPKAKSKDVPLKPSAKAVSTSKASKSKSSKPSDKPAEISKPKPTKPPPKSSKSIPAAPPTKAASTSPAPKRIIKPRRSRAKASDPYSGTSEDEYVPKTSKSKPKPKPKASASAKSSISDKAKDAKKPPPKQSGNLSDIMEEEEEEEAPPMRDWYSPRQISAKMSKASTSTMAKRTESGLNKTFSALDASEDDEPYQPSLHRTKNVVDTQKQTDLDAKKKLKSKAKLNDATKGKKRNAPEDDSEANILRPRTKQSKALDKETSSKPTQKSKSKAADPMKGKKRSVPEDESADEPSQRPTKRSKATAGDDTISGSNPGAKASKTKTTACVEPATKKRPREQADSTTSEKVDKRLAKRKKLLTEDEDEPEMAIKAPAKASKAKKADFKTKKPPSKGAKLLSGKATETALKKSTPASEKSTANVNVVSKRGPPKSVLERLKARDQPHIIDNDPDPIDFLS